MLTIDCSPIFKILFLYRLIIIYLAINIRSPTVAKIIDRVQNPGSAMASGRANPKEKKNAMKAKPKRSSDLVSVFSSSWSAFLARITGIPHILQKLDPLLTTAPHFMH